jgi:hypothetical protein
VPTRDAKPASDIGLDLISADIITFACHVPQVPLQWIGEGRCGRLGLATKLPSGQKVTVPLTRLPRLDP